MNISTDILNRNCGIGRFLINHIVTTFNFKVLLAETDDDCVGFYEKCNFDITSLGEVYPDTIRYKCTYNSKGLLYK